MHISCHLPRAPGHRGRDFVVGLTVLGVSCFVATPAIASTVKESERAPVIRMVVGDAYVDAGGHTWESETGFRGGRTAFFTDDIVGTERDELYQRERYDVDGYNIPVPVAGTYRTTLNLAELWFSAPGKRVFDVLAEGAVKDSDIDIFARAGGMYSPVKIMFDTMVSDGELSLTFLDRVDHAKVDSIKVRLVELVPTAARPAPRQAGRYVVRCGEFAVEVDAEFDEDVLRRLITVVTSC